MQVRERKIAALEKSAATKAVALAMTDEGEGGGVQGSRIGATKDVVYAGVRGSGNFEGRVLGMRVLMVGEKGEVGGVLEKGVGERGGGAGGGGGRGGGGC